MDMGTIQVLHKSFDIRICGLGLDGYGNTATCGYASL